MPKTPFGPSLLILNHPLESLSRWSRGGHEVWAVEQRRPTPGLAVRLFISRSRFMWMRLVAEANQGPMGVAIKERLGTQTEKRLEETSSYGLQPTSNGHLLFGLHGLPKPRLVGMRNRVDTCRHHACSFLGLMGWSTPGMVDTGGLALLQSKCNLSSRFPLVPSSILLFSGPC